MNVSDITIYSLNPDIYKHREFYIKELNDMKIFKAVKRISFNYKFKERLRTIIMAHLYAFIHAVDHGDFPVLFLEDDARLRKPLPTSFNVPEECMLVYLGGSNYCCGAIPNFHIKEYNSEFYRVYYMLSAHAILVPNEKACQLMVNAYTDAIFKRKFNDVSLALLSKDNIFLTPKEGLYFYQDDNSKHVTNFDWKNKEKDYLRK